MKESYNLAKSFRPISLSSFYMKGLERLVFWELERTSLTENPLHPNQHAFRKSKGTDTALSSVVNEIEKGLYNKDTYTLCVFLDIQGAFDNLNVDKAVEAMLAR